MYRRYNNRVTYYQVLKPGQNLTAYVLIELKLMTNMMISDEQTFLCTYEITSLILESNPWQYLTETYQFWKKKQKCSIRIKHIGSTFNYMLLILPFENVKSIHLWHISMYEFELLTSTLVMCNNDNYNNNCSDRIVLL